MALTLEAVYENGVFVPTERPPLAEHERVRLVVEPVEAERPEKQDIIEFWRKERIKIDPNLVREIAAGDEFSIENS